MDTSTIVSSLDKNNPLNLAVPIKQDNSIIVQRYYNRVFLGDDNVKNTTEARIESEAWFETLSEESKRIVVFYTQDSVEVNSALLFGYEALGIQTRVNWLNRLYKSLYVADGIMTKLMDQYKDGWKLINTAVDNGNIYDIPFKMVNVYFARFALYYSIMLQKLIIDAPRLKKPIINIKASNILSTTNEAVKASNNEEEVESRQLLFNSISSDLKFNAQQFAGAGCCIYLVNMNVGTPYFCIPAKYSVYPTEVEAILPASIDFVYKAVGDIQLQAHISKFVNGEYQVVKELPPYLMRTFVIDVEIPGGFVNISTSIDWSYAYSFNKNATFMNSFENITKLNNNPRKSWQKMIANSTTRNTDVYKEMVLDTETVKLDPVNDIKTPLKMKGNKLTWNGIELKDVKMSDIKFNIPEAEDLSPIIPLSKKLELFERFLRDGDYVIPFAGGKFIIEYGSDDYDLFINDNIGRNLPIYENNIYNPVLDKWVEYKSEDGKKNRISLIDKLVHIINEKLG
jgi:hypothetical protein